MTLCMYVCIYVCLWEDMYVYTYITRNVISYHKLKGINIQHMANSIKLNYDKDQESLVKQHDKALSKALDKVAPIQTKLQTVCKSILCFTDECEEVQTVHEVKGEDLEKV